MEIISEYINSFSRFFADKEVVIPAMQMVFFVGLINVCMLVRSYRVCFLVSLLFSFYWMFVVNQDTFVSLDGTTGGGGVFALGLVVFILLFSIFCFLAQKGGD